MMMKKRKVFLIWLMLVVVVGLFFIEGVHGETMDFESGTGWVDTCPNYNEFFINDWQFEPYPSHSLCRSTEEYKSSTHSIKVTSAQGAGGGPHIRYNGPKLDSFYQAMWIKVTSGMFGGSGNALKLMGSRAVGAENELMALGYDSNNFRIAMTTSAGNQNWFHFFNSQGTSNPLLLPYNEWHYIKLFQNNDGDFDAWVNGVHVTTTNSRQDGGGTWRDLPITNWAVRIIRTIIWWNLNYSGAGSLTDITYYEDDLYYGSEDPGYPGGTPSDCGDGTCESGENCPADVGSCSDNQCYEPTCNNGCGQTLVGTRQTDESCSGNNFCDGSGNCVECIDNTDCTSPDTCVSNVCTSLSTECSDGADNDGDGQIDYPNDPGCLSSTDNSEYGSAECDDGIDNDGDGDTDYRVSGGDQGCLSLTDSDETNCGDGQCEGGEVCDVCVLDCGECGSTITVEFGDNQGSDYPGTVEDTFIDVGTPDQNHVNDAHLNTYTWPVNTIANAIVIKWDISAIPVSATVTSASLQLYMDSMEETGGDNTYDVSVHRITGVNPTITTCTWNIPWSTPGGQNNIASTEDTIQVDKTYNYKTWSVTNMVQNWVSNPSQNYGMLINSDSSASIDSNRLFFSSDNSNTNQRPKLVITYSTSQTYYHPADTNQNGCVEMAELIAYIGKWKNNEGVDMILLMEAIGIWKSGGC